MTRLSAISLAVLILLPAPFSVAYAAPDAIAAADQALAARSTPASAATYKPNEPGATVIVTRDGETVFRKAYGMADVAQEAADGRRTCRCASARSPSSSPSPPS